MIEVGKVSHLSFEINMKNLNYNFFLNLNTKYYFFLMNKYFIDFFYRQIMPISFVVS